MYFNPKTAPKRYSTEMWSTNKNIQQKSEAEKKFDDLLNNKCSWTYKSVKTIRCQTRGEMNENGPTVKIRTVNIEETAYNRDFHENTSKCRLNEYDDIDADEEKKPEKSRKLAATSRNTKIIKLDSIKGNRNTGNSKVTSNKNIQRSKIRSKRNILPVSYLESDSESIQSSSDDGLVFLSRGCDKKYLNSNEHGSEDNNCNMAETLQEQTLNIFDAKNILDENNINDSQNMLLENCNEIKSGLSSELQNCGAMKNDFHQEETTVQHQKAGLNLPIDDYPNRKFGLNLILNQNLEKETDLPLSETLSGSDSNGFEEKKKMKPPQKEKNDLDSKIIRQYKTISTEVQSVCDKLKTSSDEIFNDFFHGSFNLEKYKSKIDADENASLREENNSYKSKLLSETKADNSMEINHVHANRNVIKNVDKKPDNIKDLKNSNIKTNSMSKDASKISSTKAKGDYSSKFDHIPVVLSDTNGAENYELEENGYPLINDYFKGNYSFKSHEINRTLNKIEQKLNGFDDSAHDGKLENDLNTNKPHFSDKKDFNLGFPNQYHVIRQSPNSKTKKKENVSFRNTADSNGKCVKKTKTWEDLEIDILNREEQISFLPIFDIKLSSTRKDILKDEQYQPTEIFQSGPNFNKPGNSFETENAEPQNNRSITKSKKGYFDSTTCNKKINDVALDSPNASVIDRIIRKMQLCTSPVLTPCMVKPQLEEYQTSPILTEYSYSIQEIKSTILTGKNLNEKQTKQLKSTCTNTKQQNYKLCKKSEFKRIIDSNGANTTNLTSVKLDEIPKKDNLMLLNSSESENESRSKSNTFLEMENLAPKLDKHLIPQDLLIASVDEPYNLRKRKCNNKHYRQYATKKHIAGVNNTNKSSIIINYKRDETYKQNRQKTYLIENASIENSTLNKRKQCKSITFDTSTNYIDESESEDSSQNQTSHSSAISDQQDEDLKKFKNTLKMSYEENSSQPNALLTSGKTKELDQILEKQVCGTEKSMKANGPKRRQLPKRDSKGEYEKYLRNIFGKDITEDSNAQWKFLNGTNEMSEKNLRGKDKCNFGKSKLLAEDDNYLSLSSDTDSEQQSPRRASGLLDDVFY